MGLTKPIEQNSIKLSRYIYVSKDIIRGGFGMNIKNMIRYREVWMGLAIVWVVFFHSGIWPASEFMTEIKMIGYGGVDIFMFASGIGCFCSLQKNDELIEFFKRRVLRIIPTYWCFLLMWTIYNGIYGEISWNSILGNLLCVRHLTGLGGEFNWYISAMWCMYLMAPLLKKIVDKINTKYQFVSIIGVLFLFSICFWDTTTYIIIMSRFPIFFIGMYVGKMAWQDIVIRKVGFCSCMVMMVAGIGLLRYLQNVYPDYLWSRGGYWYPFILIVPGGCMLISYMMEVLKKIGMDWIEKILAIPGKFSFEIYLLHIWFFDILNNNLIAKGILEYKRSVWVGAILMLIPLCIVLRKITSLLLPIYGYVCKNK